MSRHSVSAAVPSDARVTSISCSRADAWVANFESLAMHRHRMNRIVLEKRNLNFPGGKTGMQFSIREKRLSSQNAALTRQVLPVCCRREPPQSEKWWEADTSVTGFGRGRGQFGGRNLRYGGPESTVCGI